MKRCHLCGRVLDNPGDPRSKDCGGDCLQCMADADDPDAIAAIQRIEQDEQEERSEHG